MNKAVTLIHAKAAMPFYQGKYCLSPLTCDIQAASLVCFLGKRFTILNSYLQMLAGLTAPASGVIQHFIEENQTPVHSDFPVIAYLHTDSALLSVLNGIENVKLPALYHQLGSREQIEVRVKALLAELNYDADHTLLPSFMTQLQKRHLLIARALILEPKVLFIENPFVGLELAEIEILGNYLAQLVKNKQIALITSDAPLDFVQHFAQQIVYADDQNFHLFHDWDSFLQRNQPKNTPPLL